MCLTVSIARHQRDDMESHPGYSTRMMKLMRMTPEIECARTKPLRKSCHKERDTKHQNQPFAEIPLGAYLSTCLRPTQSPDAVEDWQQRGRCQESEHASAQRSHLAATSTGVEEDDCSSHRGASDQGPVDPLQSRIAEECIVCRGCTTSQCEQAYAEDIHLAPEMMNVERVTSQRMKGGAESEADGACGDGNGKCEFITSAEIERRQSCVSVETDASGYERYAANEMCPDVHRLHVQVAPKSEGPLI